MNKLTKRLAGIALLGAGAVISSTASADECSLTITVNDAMQFDTKELSVPASCKTVELTLTHSGTLPVTAMGHNWVLSKSADMQGIATDGMAAGADAAYVKAGDERVIAHTPLVGGGESVSISFSTEGMTPEESYNFFCSFPGHWAVMQGSFSIKG
ncbi:azurin [Shewanella algae]|uniref:azurin n=1 Tax=Shewanella algae TaxID=38313 RepID=UPI003AACBF5B